MNAPTRILPAAVVDADTLEVRMWASLWRPFRRSPRPDVFLRMAQYAFDTGLIGSTFVDACRQADREHQARPTSGRPNRHLPESLRQAIDYLLRENDADRLKKFLAGRSQAETQKILAYIEGKRS
jgi:hypothetical protein